MSKNRKATHDTMSLDYLERRAKNAERGGYQKPRWIEFCEDMLRRGYHVRLYEARQTFSKYITVLFRKRSFKVRFSNHKPCKQKEANRDCDFFVGITHFGVTRTEDAIKATVEFLEQRKEDHHANELVRVDSASDAVPSAANQS